MHGGPLGGPGSWLLAAGAWWFGLVHGPLPVRDLVTVVLALGDGV